MAVRLTTVDAFTDTPFAGNPAAVCVLDRPADAGWMQAVAAELNLSETAFVSPGAGGAWDLRWFTPTSEVPLCGHATLASAHVLMSDGHAPAGTSLRFRTASGELVAESAADGRIRLDFPARPAHPSEPPPGLPAALGDAADQVVAVGVSPVPDGRPGLLVELASAEAVRSLVPDIGAVAALAADLVMVTAAGDRSSADVVSRCFAPAMGIPEDPVTGAAHCTIGPWWAPRLGTTLRCHQASPRGGDLLVTVAEDRVGLTGHAVTVLRAELQLEAEPIGEASIEHSGLSTRRSLADQQ